MPPRVTRQALAPFHVVDEQKQFEERKQMALANCTRQECFDQGYLTVKDLDDEELVAGRCRDQSGYIPRNSKKTELIPKEKYDDMVAEHEARFKQKLRQNLDDMVDIMVDIAKDETAEPRDRFEAAKYIFERTAGRTPETVNVTVRAAPWEALFGDISGVAAITRAEHKAAQRGIIDVEYTEEEADGAKSPGMGEEDAGDQATMAPVAQGAPPSDDIGSASDQSDEDLVEDVRQDQPIPPDGEVTDADLEDVCQDRHKVYDNGIELPADGKGQVTGQEPDHGAEHMGAPAERPLVTDANPELNYGRRGDEARSYADQARAAQKLMAQRKEAREARNLAKKKRKIARAMGADAIKTEITGAELAPDGTLRFGEE